MLEKLRSESRTRIELEFLCGLCVENLAKPIGPSDESVTNEKGRVSALPKSLIEFGSLSSAFWYCSIGSVSVIANSLRLRTQTLG
jgi:hypothetical protein